MIRLTGEIFLYAALICASFQAFFPLLGLRNRNIYLLAFAPSFALCQFLFVTFAFVLLATGFLINDFSISFVAQNSHEDLPLLYKLTAVWGGHEGSVLLWILFLSTWTIIFSKFNKQHVNYHLVLAILAIINFCFLIFICFTSNPFDLSQSNSGQDLNPLLQDPGFIIHPPMLYIGYVGMCVPFATTLAALITNKLDIHWAKITHVYTLAAWCFLTLGITLGSWWAYRVLGWGGFWFWDPVENASLLPWLCAIALVHVLIVVEQRDIAKNWAALLAIICFVLSVLGTFLVRSGILVSTHTFANDPKRGVYLLLLLAVITATAFIFYFKHCARSQKGSTTSLNFFSRELSLLLNSVLICTALATILLGTLYPLIIDALHLGSVSVGAPYFNTVLMPLVLVILFAMSISAYLKWYQTNIKSLLITSSKNLIFSLVITFIINFYLNDTTIISILTMTLSIWVILSVFEQRKQSYGMLFAHTGFAVLILGVILSNTLSIEKQVSMRPGHATKIGPYQFFFLDAKLITSTNYRGVQAVFEVLKGRHHVTTMYPEKRIYAVRNMVMTNVDIHPGIFRDLYIALGQPLEQDYWSVKIYYKPFMRWVWAGGGIMMLGGILILLQRRFTIKTEKKYNNV